jgi:hypothetical protein
MINVKQRINKAEIKNPLGCLLVKIQIEIKNRTGMINKKLTKISTMFFILFFVERKTKQNFDKLIFKSRFAVLEV